MGRVCNALTCTGSQRDPVHVLAPDPPPADGPAGGGGEGTHIFHPVPKHHPDIPRPIVNTTTSALLFFATIGLGMELTHPPDLTQDDVFVSCFSFSLNGMKSTE